LKSRAYYQFGSLTLKKRAKSADVWEFRYYEDAATGGRARKALFIGTTDQYKTEAQARKAVEAILLKLNAEKPMHHLGTVTFGGLCDRYIAEELPERYSTRKSYLSNINQHIKPRWGEYLIGAVRPMAVEGWFKEMDKSPKTKAHIRSVMHVIFECAARWEFGVASIDCGSTPASSMMWPAVEAKAVAGRADNMPALESDFRKLRRF
jgi:integrase